VTAEFPRVLQPADAGAVYRHTVTAFAGDRFGSGSPEWRWGDRRTSGVQEVGLRWRRHVPSVGPNEAALEGIGEHADPW
jgi:hypothetical protein